MPLAALKKEGKMDNKKVLAFVEKMSDAFYTLYDHMRDNMPDCDDDYAAEVEESVSGAYEDFRDAEKQLKEALT